MKNLAAWLLVALAWTACKKQGTDSPPDTGTDDNPANAVVETAPANQKGVTVNVNSNIGGYMEALPARYDSTTKKYPLLVFLHGVGELGNGSTDLNNAASVGTPAVIKYKQLPPNFVVNNKNYSFIVITPQFKAWPSAGDVNTMISYAISKYRIDTTRMYVSGLSMGGGVAWEYAAAYSSRIAAVAPICGASGPNDSKAKKIADAHLAVWAFHNKDDGTVTYTNSTGYVEKINSNNASPAAKLTLWDTGGHDAWTKATSPAYKEGGKNMYEWMLQYSRAVNQ